MKLVVTGSNGLLGRHVALAAFEAGHEVTGIDSRPSQDPVGWTQITADLTDLAACLQIFPGADAIAHVAGIPRPVGEVPSHVFKTNVALTFNVTEAAILGSVKRLVYASSMSALGYPFFTRRIEPTRLPIDSTQPTQAQDAYGLSKWIGEEIIDAGVRRAGLQAVSLRLPWIQTEAGFKQLVAGRRIRGRERPCDLWAYVDARDAARAFLAGLTAPVEGHVRCFITARDTFMEEPTEDLVRAAYPVVPRSKSFAGHETIIAMDEARASIGFEPCHSWRDYGMADGAEQDRSGDRYG